MGRKKQVTHTRKNNWLKSTEDGNLIFILMVISLLLRLAYCVYVPYDISTHDLGAAIQNGSDWFKDGHIGYVQYIYQHGSLPEGDPRTLWSYYNPPFYYIVSALFLKVNSFFGTGMGQMLENLQILLVVFATITIFVGYRILKEFGIRGKALVISFAILAFHPYFIIGGVTLNNDMLSILFVFLTVLYTIRWYKEAELKTICKIALCIGLGMMTKLSVGLIAIPVAMLFLVKFVKEKDYKAYFLQFVVFGFICIPLGMYWSIRNAVLYGMPLVYVQELGTSTKQYVGYDIARRGSLFDLFKIADPYIRINPDTDFNIWTSLFKTAVFDEYKVSLSEGAIVKVSYLLLYSSISLGILGLFTGVYHYFNKENRRNWLYIFKSILYLAFIASYLKFCFQFPVICSMNFRYVVPVVVVAAVNLGLYLQREKTSRVITFAIACCAIVFVASSILLYGVLKLC